MVWTKHGTDGRIPRGLAAVVVSTTVLSGTPSRASVVVFDNSDGTFFWQLGIRDVDGTPYPGTFLDITQPPSQPSHQRPGTLGKWYRPNQSSDEPAVRYVIGEPGAHAARTTEYVTINWNGQPPFYVWALRDYSALESVSETARWSVDAPYFYHLPFSYSLQEGTPAIGDPAYLGVRVKMADNQWHYGWIHFTEYAWPTMWAYETEPNVPIQVPVPGPAAGACMVALGLGLSSRRHRS